MTDDRVAGLPDAGTIQPGDPGHIETHDRMAELMQFAAERIGIILDPPAPKPAVIGEYGHVQAHNDLLANIEQIAREAGTAVGGPPAPVLTNPEGGGVVAFTSGGEGVGGPTIAYGAEIEPNDHGETVTVDVTDPAVGGEVAVSGTQPFTDYIVTVYGVNVAGRGESATTDAFQLNYNLAVGGVVPEGVVVDDYRGTGEKWKYHEFTAAGNAVLDVKQSIKPWEALVIAGGGRGAGQWGNGAQGFTGGAGGSGGVIYTGDSGAVDAADVPVGENTITVGAQNTNSVALGLTATRGGNGQLGPGQSGGSGAGSAHHDYIKDPPGNGTAYQGHTGGNQAWQGVISTGGGPGQYEASIAHTTGHRTVAIKGTNEQVAGWNSGKPGAGGAGGGWDYAGGPGKTGIVVIAYQIGISTKREIREARRLAVARDAGYEDGKLDGAHEKELLHIDRWNNFMGRLYEVTDEDTRQRLFDDEG